MTGNIFLFGLHLQQANPNWLSSTDAKEVTVMLTQELHGDEQDATMSYGINRSFLHQNNVDVSFAEAKSFRQLFPYDVNATPPWKEVKRW